MFVFQVGINLLMCLLSEIRVRLNISCIYLNRYSANVKFEIQTFGICFKG